MKMAVFPYRILILSLILVLSSCSTSEPEEDVVIENTSVPELEAQLLIAVNTHRKSLGLNMLEYSAMAQESADLHNDYMIAKGKLSHDNFDSRASKIATQTDAKEVGENVARNHSTAEKALQGWLDSTPHKTTLENNYTHTAISVKKDSKGNIYYTQIFFK